MGGVEEETLTLGELLETGAQDRLEKASQMQLVAARLVPEGQKVLEHVMNLARRLLEQLRLPIDRPARQVGFKLPAHVVKSPMLVVVDDGMQEVGVVRF